MSFADSGLPLPMIRKMYADLVGRAMFCPATGKVLDVRTAAVVEQPDGKVVTIVSPEALATAMETGFREKFPALRIVVNGKVKEN